jgi:hypothetical protein
MFSQHYVFSKHYQHTRQAHVLGQAAHGHSEHLRLRWVDEAIHKPHKCHGVTHTHLNSEECELKLFSCCELIFHKSYFEAKVNMTRRSTNTVPSCTRVRLSASSLTMVAVISTDSGRGSLITHAIDENQKKDQIDKCMWTIYSKK